MLPACFHGGRSTILVERFLANPEWQTLYDQVAARLETELFESGVAEDVREKWTTILDRSGGRSRFCRGARAGGGRNRGDVVVMISDWRGFAGA